MQPPNCALQSGSQLPVTLYQNLCCCGVGYHRVLLCPRLDISCFFPHSFQSWQEDKGGKAEAPSGLLLCPESRSPLFTQTNIGLMGHNQDPGLAGETRVHGRGIKGNEPLIGSLQGQVLCMNRLLHFFSMPFMLR